MKEKKLNREDKDVLSLDGKTVGNYWLHLENLRRGRFVEERNFELFLKDSNENLSIEPVVFGKYFGGRGKWMPIWLEVTYRPFFRITPAENDEISLIDSQIEEDIFKELSVLIPKGGRMFVMYTTPGTNLTKAAFESSTPLMLTPLGYLMWKNGFRWFKDWYFAEGWSEGGQKLQGNKPLNNNVKYQRDLDTIIKLQHFLEEVSPDETLKKRAYYILETIKETWCN